jgi:hypothetical protein
MGEHQRRPERWPLPAQIDIRTILNEQIDQVHLPGCDGANERRLSTRIANRAIHVGAGGDEFSKTNGFFLIESFQKLLLD